MLRMARQASSMREFVLPLELQIVGLMLENALSPKDRVSYLLRGV